MKISIVIPTHNRADTLQACLKSIEPLQNEADVEVVVVDNNSTDHTRKVAESQGDWVRYVFEGRTAFTRARSTGAENAKGDILLYLDDDTLMFPGSLRSIVDVFKNHPDCGVIAGRIEPKYEQDPPGWTLDCQRTFNGWSLYSKDYIPGVSASFQEVESAAGPMMAILKKAYDQVGGFPPDTVGVETNKGPRTFNKLYIGPGDYGLCHLMRQAGYKIYYSTEIAVYHVIPAVRFTVKFWRSRMIGEAYHEAVVQRCFFRISRAQQLKKRLKARLKLFRYERKLLAALQGHSAGLGDFMAPEELWVQYYRAFLDMDRVLARHPDLPSFLWEIGKEGVSNAQYDSIVGRMPNDFKALVSNEIVYDQNPVNSPADYSDFLRRRDTQIQALNRGKSA